MTDRNVQYPNRFHVKPVPGTDDICEIIPAPGTVYEDGTFWNKQNVLQDAVAALYGKDATATPNDIFSAIRLLIQTAQSSADGKAVVSTGSYSGSGTTAKTLSFSFLPKLVVIESTENASSMSLVRGAAYGNSGYGWAKLTWGANSVSLSSSDAQTSLNNSGTVYHYIAIA